MGYIVTLRLDFKLRASHRARADDIRADNPETKSIHGKLRRARARARLFDRVYRDVVLQFEILTTSYEIISRSRSVFFSFLFFVF